MKNKKLFILLSSYYGLYLKTQSYHWNITGINFYSFHKMLEDLYKSLSDDIDEIAESIRILGEKVSISFKDIESFSIIKNPNENLNAIEMIADLYNEIQKIIDFSHDLLNNEYKENVFVQNLISEKLTFLQKQSWFLKSIIENQ